MTIETNQYIATATEVEKLARTILDADGLSTGGRSTYFKAVVATTQAELGSGPRMRNAKAAKLDEAEVTAHLKAFETVAARFHDAVLKAAQEIQPKPTSDELRSRTAFSRSALSTVRGYIRGGNDVRALAAHKATKRALATPMSKRKFTVEILKARATALSEKLAEVAKNLHAANREEAAKVMQGVLAQLTVAAGLSAHMTRDADKAIEASEPFSTKSDVFIPINLAAVREQRKVA